LAKFASSSNSRAGFRRVKPVFRPGNLSKLHFCKALASVVSVMWGSARGE
jgi:hypothetical protein